MTLEDLTHLEPLDSDAILGGASSYSSAETTMTMSFFPLGSVVFGKFDTRALGPNTLTQTDAKQKAYPWRGFGRIWSFAAAQD